MFSQRCKHCETVSWISDVTCAVTFVLMYTMTCHGAVTCHICLAIQSQQGSHVQGRAGSHTSRGSRSSHDLAWTRHNVTSRI